MFMSTFVYKSYYYVQHTDCTDIPEFGVAFSLPQKMGICKCVRKINKSYLKFVCTAYEIRYPFTSHKRSCFLTLTLACVYTLFVLKDKLCDYIT